jgi:uncharacterized protein
MVPEHRSTLRGRPVVAGNARGTALLLEHGLSFAMALDVADGRITDVHSPYSGTSVSGRVLVMPAGRGSSSASTALAEAIRVGTAPAAMLLAEVDEILTVGAIVARTLYGHTCPIVILASEDMAAIETGAQVDVERDGSVSLERSTISASREGR